MHGLRQKTEAGRAEEVKMLHSFTRNYEDNSTEAGFQFTFYCDLCHDGFKSSFVESETYKKGQGFIKIARGAGVLGSLLGGRMGDFGWSLERGGDILSERFNGMSPEWQKEHEIAFEYAKNEAQRYFHRCHSCRQWVCDACFNEEEELCTDCAPRRNISIAKARSAAMQRNIEEEAEKEIIWEGKLESRTIVCPQCGKPVGGGKFCNHCGAPTGRRFAVKCPVCGEENTPDAKFCTGCGNKM